MGIFKVTYHLGKGKEETIYRYELNEKELELQTIFFKKAALTEEEIHLLHRGALLYIGVGDPWTAEKILKRLINEKADPDYFYRMGVVYTQLGRTIEAEHYLEMCRTTGSLSDKALANYILSMLYARHHQKFLLDINKSKNFLEEAYEILCSLSETDLKDIHFHKIFNRNGYALVLFREGKIQEAIELLNFGISNLNDKNKKLHKTVLIYNLAQCFTKIEKYGEALELYNQVISHDPYYPENYLEYARVLIFSGDYKKGLEVINRSIELDPFFLEAYSLAGYCYDELGETNHCIENYKKAWKLDKTKIDSAYEYGYALSELERYEECLMLLENIEINPSQLEVSSLRNIITLHAEAALNCQGVNDAVQILMSGLNILPEDSEIKKNLKILRSMKVNVNA
ncbi:tetratricopeptide repeat protein [Paenibacillus pinistramenti]|uniref:tetratricopeptide repeat protein n=1 Tax=Paenibacillus pinistramenti TaxID=1768003 RepID=UPI001107B0F2|nr:tetratricopeptide repeat protein [Paenibacillus pinistramenti]